MSESVWGIDTIDANVDKVPLGTPVIWCYITGTTSRPEIEWEPDDIALFSRSQVYKVDQGYGDQADEARWFACHEFDLEAGAWTIPRLVDAIRGRNGRKWSSRVYASVEPFTLFTGALRAAQVSMRSLYWREANWSLSEEEARGQLGGIKYAVQWASPSSNPDTMIPGTHLTLAEAGADLNVIRLGSTQWQG